MKITTEQLSKKLFSSMTLSELTKFEIKDELLTGVNSLDTDFGFPTGYYIIIGNQGVGKSWFALWLSRVFYRNNLVKSVYFSLEMPEPLVRKRILQQWSDLTKSELESGESTQQAINLLNKDIVLVDEFYEQDTKFRTPENFKSWVEEYYKLGYRVFHMDHFHELDGASTNQTNQGVVERWGLAFQQLCKKYPDIWLLVFAQPKSSDYGKSLLDRNSLRGSKAIIDKCDYVMSLNKSITRDENGIVIRNEDDGKIMLYLDKTRYTENPNIAFRLQFLPTGNFGSYTKGTNEKLT